MAAIGSLKQHLQYWDPPKDVQDDFRHFASYEEGASFEKWEGTQNVYRCNDGGLDAAIKPVLQKLQLQTVILALL